MGKRIVFSALCVMLLGSAAVLAQGQTPQHPMNFFVAATVPASGKLGGLIGADRLCQTLAQAHGAGNHIWRAYLSTQATAQAAGVNARDRIGPGPWYNAKGVMIAANVADLHGDLQRDRNNIQKATALNERGATGPGMGDPGNEHDILTGSDSEGRAFPAGLDKLATTGRARAATIARCSVIPTARAAACRGIRRISAATAPGPASSRPAARAISTASPSTDVARAMSGHGAKPRRR